MNWTFLLTGLLLFGTSAIAQTDSTLLTNGAEDSIVKATPSELAAPFVLGGFYALDGSLGPFAQVKFRRLNLRASFLFFDEVGRFDYSDASAPWRLTDSTASFIESRDEYHERRLRLGVSKSTWLGAVGIDLAFGRIQRTEYYQNYNAAYTADPTSSIINYSSFSSAEIGYRSERVNVIGIVPTYEIVFFRRSPFYCAVQLALLFDWYRITITDEVDPLARFESASNSQFNFEERLRFKLGYRFPKKQSH